jgi:osmoprotectant transport system permease protein
MYIVGLGQTIPSLAVLALAMSLLGVGRGPAVLALVIYTVLPIARNTLAGLEAVEEDLIDAARGMGLSPLQILLEVELPNALRVILTGFRLALVINIGTAALGALVGAGGLGDQIFTGITFLRTELMLSGAIPTALLALTADYGVQGLEKLLVSEGLKLAED